MYIIKFFIVMMRSMSNNCFYASKIWTLTFSKDLGIFSFSQGVGDRILSDRRATFPDRGAVKHNRGYLPE